VSYLEWGLAGEALEDDGAEGPQVGLRIILQGHDHLRRLKQLLVLKNNIFYRRTNTVSTVNDKIRIKSVDPIKIKIIIKTELFTNSPADPDPL
jgi:hypothetical protein